MPLRRVTLEDFSAFGKVSFDLAPGINVLIGENATGKTHAMKAIYAGLRAVSSDTTALSPTARIALQLARVFRPDDGKLGHLPRRRHGHTTGSVKIEAGKGIWLRYSISSRTGKVTARVTLPRPPTALFIPSRELLALYEGLLQTMRERELSLDETYYDACLALSAAPLRGVKAGIQEVIDDLHGVLGGRVELVGNRFYVKAGRARLEAHLVSEGLRKLAAIVRLLQNGSLREHGVLLWDEPEANLNPQLVVLVADVLVSLAAIGIQVIVATHDYLLLQTLGLHSETSDVEARFFSLFRTKSVKDGVKMISAEHPDALANNPIRDEFLAHYDRVRGAVSAS
ncbi:MAG: AAA family ATPase [Myxococcota bacterium]